MDNYLVPVDGSEHSLRALAEVAAEARRMKEPVRVHLVNVQVPLGGVHVKTFIAKETLDDYYRELGRAALAPAREQALAAGLQVEEHIGVGDPGEVVVEYAKDRQCRRICMGTRGLGTVKSMVLGSVAVKIVHLSPVPVLLVK